MNASNHKRVIGDSFGIKDEIAMSNPRPYEDEIAMSNPRPHDRFWLHAAIACVLGFSPLLPFSPSPLLSQAAEIQYNRDIRPILADNCFACHGPDSAARKASLRLDLREEAIKAKAIIPGKPGESALIVRTHSTDVDEMMPPPKTRKKLTPKQKDLLQQWIATGAEYQPHWSYITPKRPELPQVKNAAWARNPIDRFILVELERRGLQPAPEADRRTLARRLSLDLIGLPPTPAEVEEFVNDKSADYYEKYVKKLMDSPHWGEHRGRYWLDVARYADTHGIHFDNYREVWSYRDWVIRAFNENKPFDRFTIEQLAGDLLPDKTVDTQIASGFNRCNITSAEGGMIAEEYLVLYTRDRTETTSLTWLGMTAGCAVCHSHKFDPLSQREFYEMAAFFNNTTQDASDGNVQNTPPIITVPRAEDRARWDAIAKEVNDLRKKIDGRRLAVKTDFDAWVAKGSARDVNNDIPVDGLILHGLFSEGEGKSVSFAHKGTHQLVRLGSGIGWGPGHVADQSFKSVAGGTITLPDVGDFERTDSFSFGGWVKLGRDTGAIFSRMDDQKDFRGWDLWTQNEQVGTHIVNRWPDDALKVVSKNPVPRNKWNHVFVTYDGSGKAASVKIYVNGIQQETVVEKDALKSSIKTDVPFAIAQRKTTSRLNNLFLQDVRIYNRALPHAQVERLAASTRAAYLVSKPADKRSKEEQDELLGWYLVARDSQYRDLQGKIEPLLQEEVGIKSRGTIAHVMNEKMSSPGAFVLYRGDYDKKRDAVQPGTPKALPPFPDDLPKNRLGFAKWLLQPDHPLTARVTVNRFWQDVFGTGIVRTSGDFGVAGELPTHPALLDWMAVEFRESGWDVKKFFTHLVTSATYRQAAIANPDKLEKDPQNRLLSRGPRFRMDAEMIRDYALASSGMLVKKIGGPSVKPYQPPGVWEAVAMIGSNTRDYKADKGESLYRRSMYTFWKRAAPPASMEIFNAPNRETCATRRERTNTPLQALVTLNDPQFVEAARVLAQATLKEAGDKDEARLDFMAKRILCRPLRADETKIIRGVQKELLDYYKAEPAEAKKLLTFGETLVEGAMDPASLAAWTMVANQLLNLDEVLNK
jgi:Protein of unknown function (DUF1553)/Protein of unknown function (DUF1549)/Concanavalin A-like lectin/glucanases superfamily/Planctomycete cytochrome C